MQFEQTWFKGNIHMHSFWSDGQDFPEVVAFWFKEHGYHFVAFTEHDQLQIGQRWVSTDPSGTIGRAIARHDLLATYRGRFADPWVERREGDAGTEVRLKPLDEYRHLLEEPGRFLMVDGEEISVSWAGGRHWMNAINPPAVIPPRKVDGSSVDAMALTVDAVRVLGERTGRACFVVLNHPNFLWNATAEDIASTPGLRFIEVHVALESTKSYGEGLHVGTERIWDVCLAKRLSQPDGDVVFGLVTDDSHVYHPDGREMGPEQFQAHPGRAWIMVRASHLTPEKIVGGLLSGDFYGSTGVTLRALELSESAIRLSIEPIPGVCFRTQFIGTRRGVDLTGTPVVDDAGAPIHTTARYSEQVGDVFAETDALEAAYECRGDELYVRAVVISDRPHPMPTIAGDVMKAWTQPLVPRIRLAECA